MNIVNAFFLPFQARRSILSTADVDEKELEDFYRNDGPHAERRLRRQSSRTSIGSAASAQSGSSSGDLSRQSSVSSKHMSRQSSTTTETQEMGIQTTIGKNSNGLSLHHRAAATGQNGQTSENGAKKKERKPSKVKKLFRRKSSSTDANGNGEPVEALPELPQGFIVKYMGKRATNGLWGSKHTRGPVEDIVESISKMPKGDDLPLVNLDVFYQGLAMRPHSKNKVKTFKAVQIPIQFISYGLQDTVYARIFCFIMVKQMSSQIKDMEVHAYACDSAKSARNLAACLAIAFQTYSEKLQGGPFKFTVDIPMAEEDEIDSKSCYDA